MVTRARKHNYLGMKIRLTEDGKVAINMSKQIQDIYENFCEKIDRVVMSPAMQQLYKVTRHQKNLTGQRKQELYLVVQKLLYLTKRGRPDKYLTYVQG